MDLSHLPNPSSYVCPKVLPTVWNCPLRRSVQRTCACGRGSPLDGKDDKAGASKDEAPEGSEAILMYLVRCFPSSVDFAGLMCEAATVEVQRIAH